MLCHCSTYRHHSTALHIDAVSWQRPGGTMPWLFLGLCSQFSLTQKASVTRPPLLTTAAGREKDPLPVYSAHPAISQADLRKCPFGTCHKFSDWQWVKFGQNKCGSCCWPWVALNTSSSGAWLFPGPLLCWSYKPSFSLPPPQLSMTNYLLLGCSGLEWSKMDSCFETWQLKPTFSIWSDKYHPEHLKKPFFSPWEQKNRWAEVEMFSVPWGLTLLWT